MDNNPQKEKEPEDIFAGMEMPAPKPAGPAPLKEEPIPSPAILPEGPRKNRRALWLIFLVTIVLVVIIGGIYIFSTDLFKKEGNTNLKNEAINLANVNKANANVTGPANLVNQPLDSDKDGLTDEEEVSLGTNPNSPDTESDGLSDRDEVKIYKTDPKNKDTDGDGYSDGDEVKGGYNPLGPGKLLDLTNAVNKLLNTNQ